MVLKVFISSQTPSQQIRKQQRAVTDYLEANKIQVWLSVNSYKKYVISYHS